MGHGEQICKSSTDKHWPVIPVLHLLNKCTHTQKSVAVAGVLQEGTPWRQVSTSDLTVHVVT